MSDPLNAIPAAERDEPLLDTFLREAVPEIKLSLGDLIDRDNTRAIPDRYAKLLPESVLVVTLRPDAAEAVRPIAAELEGELTDSCMRHGSLYDREYRVKLRVANAPGAPLFRVAVRKADEPEPEPLPPPRPPEPARAPEPRNETPSPAAAATEVIRPGALGGETVVAPRPTPLSETVPPAPPPRPAPPSEPEVDPDATRLEGMPPPSAPAAGAPGLPRFEAERWTLVVEDEEGNEKERFPLPAAMSTVGRQTDNPDLKSDVQVAGVPHVSRRQLALVWAPRGDRPGFTVYNVGLNALHVGDREVPGANRGRGDLRLDELMADHSEWVGPGLPMRIGEHGPVVRLEDSGAGDDEADGVEVDPDATRLG